MHKYPQEEIVFLGDSGTEHWGFRYRSLGIPVQIAGDSGTPIYRSKRYKRTGGIQERQESGCVKNLGNHMTLALLQ